MGAVLTLASILHSKHVTFECNSKLSLIVCIEFSIAGTAGSCQATRSCSTASHVERPMQNKNIVLGAFLLCRAGRMMTFCYTRHSPRRTFITLSAKLVKYIQEDGDRRD
jgi:hypothetical protein